MIGEARRQGTQKPPRQAGRSGLAAVELAILAPLLAFLFVISVDYARIFHYTMIVTNCARNGAYYGCADTTSALDTDGIKTAAKRDASNLNSANIDVSVARDNDSNPSYVQVTVTYPFTTVTRYPGVPASLTLSRSVKMLVCPRVPN